MARGVDAVIQSAAYARGTEMRGVEVAHDRLDGRSEDFVRQLGRSPSRLRAPAPTDVAGDGDAPLAHARVRKQALQLGTFHLGNHRGAFSLARSKRRIVVLHVFDRPRDVGAHPVESSATRARAPVAVDECRWRATSKLTCDCTRGCYGDVETISHLRESEGCGPAKATEEKRSHPNAFGAPGLKGVAMNDAGAVTDMARTIGLIPSAGGQVYIYKPDNIINAEAVTCPTTTTTATVSPRRRSRLSSR